MNFQSKEDRTTEVEDACILAERLDAALFVKSKNDIFWSELRPLLLKFCMVHMQISHRYFSPLTMRKGFFYAIKSEWDVTNYELKAITEQVVQWLSENSYETIQECLCDMPSDHLLKKIGSKLMDAETQTLETAIKSTRYQVETLLNNRTNIAIFGSAEDDKVEEMISSALYNMVRNGESAIVYDPHGILYKKIKYSAEIMAYQIILTDGDARSILPQLNDILHGRILVIIGEKYQANAKDYLTSIIDSIEESGILPYHLNFFLSDYSEGIAISNEYFDKLRYLNICNASVLLSMKSIDQLKKLYPQLSPMELKILFPDIRLQNS